LSKVKGKPASPPSRSQGNPSDKSSVPERVARARRAQWASTGGTPLSAPNGDRPMPLRIWLIFVAVLLARIASGLQMMSVGAVGPELMVGLDLGYAALGTLIGVYSLPGMALAFPGGWLMARYGDRAVLLLGIGLMTAGGALMTLASGFPALLAGR